MHMRNYNDLPHLAGHGDLQCHLRHGFGQLQQKVEQSRFESGGGAVAGDLTAQSWAQPLITSDGQPGAPTELKLGRGSARSPAVQAQSVGSCVWR